MSTKEKINIQIQNNVILRKMFKSEQDSNKEHTKKIAKLEKEINALKNNSIKRAELKTVLLKYKI